MFIPNSPRPPRGMALNLLDTDGIVLFSPQFIITHILLSNCRGALRGPVRPRLCPERSALLRRASLHPKHLGLTLVQEWIQHLVNHVALPECLKPAIKFCELVKRELLGAHAGW